MEIIANERIECISKFYVQGASNSKNIIEENFKNKQATEDSKGV